MQWFNRPKPKPKEIWDEPIEWPIGDIEAAHRIRDICHSAADSAAKAGSLVGSLASNLAGDRDSKQQQYEVQRYENAGRAAMEIAMKITDDLLRDSAVRQIIDLCFKAGDLRTSRILFRAIQSASIRQEVLLDHPLLGP
jgi:hypothetical protein